MLRFRLARICSIVLVAALVSCSARGSSLIPAAPSRAGLQGATAGYPSVILSDAPTAYYHLDDAGTSAVDASGNGLNGIVGTSVAKNAPGLIPAYTDAAMSFPGLATTAGMVIVAQTTKLQPASAVSLEAWIRFVATPSTYTFVVGYGSDNALAPYGFYFGASGQLHAQFALSGGNVDMIDPTALSANKAYHLVETYDGATARLYVNGVQVVSRAATGTLTNYLSGYGFAIGDDAQRVDPAFDGTVDEVAVYAGKALAAAQIANHYAAATTTSTPTPSPTPGATYSDWSTFGDNLQRTGYNPNEKTLTSANVAAGLKTMWSTDLGGAITAQPVLATNVSINGISKNVLYIGAENNVFYAIDADTGAVIWKNATFGSPRIGACIDLPGGQFGITGTATFSRSAGIVYAADANDKVHALSMTTGTEQWSANLLFDPNTNAVVGTPQEDHVYGALALNPANGLLYAYTGSLCEIAPWHGRIVSINTSTHAIAAAFFPARTGSGKTGTSYCGGGIWGMGGASIDVRTNDVFVATGNNIAKSTAGGCLDDTVSETYPYGDAIAMLTAQLGLVSYSTATINGGSAGYDSDYGATPMLYTTPNCANEQLSAKNKDGIVYTDGVASTLIAEQQLPIGMKTSGGDFIGVPAFDPTSGLVYVGDPMSSGTYAHGLDAFAQTSGGCTGLTLSWKASIGSANAVGQDNEAPTVADGIVYFTDGQDDQVWAFNDRTGSVLWHSGTAIGSPCTAYGTACGVFGAPTVDGRVFVGSFNHWLYAFGR